jgi:hypothetical protein
MTSTAVLSETDIIFLVEAVKKKNLCNVTKKPGKG